MKPSAKIYKRPEGYVDIAVEHAKRNQGREHPLHPPTRLGGNRDPGDLFPHISGSISPR